MTNAQITNELKEKALPTFGTAQEKKNRLKQFHKIPVSAGGGPALQKKKSTREAVKELAANREKRRMKMEEVKANRQRQEKVNKANGIKCDVQF